MANGDCVLGNKNATKIDNLKEDFTYEYYNTKDI